MKLTVQQQALLQEPLSVLELDARTKNALEDPTTHPVVQTVGELLACRQEDLLTIPNFGQKALQHVLERLAAHGFLPAGVRAPTVTQQAGEDRKAALKRDVLGF